MIKTILVKLAKQFKRFPCFGWQRFWFLYWCYKITGWHIRHEEWDFILKYLPKLNNIQRVFVMDVGCNRNLLCHELIRRKYYLCGVDIEMPDFKYPGMFRQMDMSSKGLDLSHKKDFVICISVLEHIGNGEALNAFQRIAIENMCESLRIGGRLLLTCPTREFAQGHPWMGFSWAKMGTIMPKTMGLIESTERAGQLCMALERIE